MEIQEQKQEKKRQKLPPRPILSSSLSDAAAQTVVETTVVTNISDAEKALELYENDVTFGGGIGTDLSFKYVAKNVVFVTGSIMVNVADTAIDAIQATTFTGTGY